MRVNWRLSRHSGVAGLVRIVVGALVGRLRTDHDFTELAGPRLTVRTRRPTRLNVSLGGELSLIDTPLAYSILPKALRVLPP